MPNGGPYTAPGGGNGLFGTDYLDNGGGSAFSPKTFAHYPAQGFNVIFRDGSAQFVQSKTAFGFITTGGNPAGSGLLTDESNTSHQEYDQMFNYLENGN